MYMQYERQSDSTQQTEQSYLRDLLKSKQDCTLGSDDLCAKPSQTEASYLCTHHTPKYQKSNDYSGKSTYPFTPMRSKSADPPPVKTLPCACTKKNDSFGIASKTLFANDQREPSPFCKKCSKQGQHKEKDSFKSALSSCTKQILNPGMGGGKSPYWWEQCNLLPTQSCSKAMHIKQISAAETTCTCRTGASKSEANLTSTQCPNKETFLCDLRDADSISNSYNQGTDHAGPTSAQKVSCECSYQSKSGDRSGHPCNQPSFGMDDETSATTRSQSILRKITCLCESNKQQKIDPDSMFLDCSTFQVIECRSYEDRSQENPSYFMPCDCTRIHHPSSQGEYLKESQMGISEKAASVCWKKVNQKSHGDDFCDCVSTESAPAEVKSNTIVTSLHTQRSISGCSCVKEDYNHCTEGSASQDISKQTDMCSCTDGTAFHDMSKQTDMCSGTNETGFQTPQENISNACTTRRERIIKLLNQLNNSCCDCSSVRAHRIQQLFREITLLLRSEKESAVAPIDEPCQPRLPFDDCCTIQQDRGGISPPEKPKTKKELRRLECFEALENMLQKCFQPRQDPQIPITDLYGFEVDPNFSPDGVLLDPQKMFLNSTDKFHDIGDTRTCDESEQSVQLDGEIYQDCIEGDANDGRCLFEMDVRNNKDCHETYKKDYDSEICNKLKAFYERKKKEMLESIENTPDEKAIDTMNNLLPPGELPPEIRSICEDLLRQALKDCHIGDEQCDCNDSQSHDDCDECPDECLTSKGEEPQGCLCCHCRALICDDDGCKTVANTLRSAMCDPLCEMKYFIDSIIIDMHAMDCVLGDKKAKPKDVKLNDRTNTAPGESFPVTIVSVCNLGCSALYIQWEVADCRAVAGYEIYVDGRLMNRLYSFRHEAAVVTNVDVTNPHQIVLRAQAVGQEFPGEGDGVPEKCGCQVVAPTHPELAAGAERPWSPSVFYYDPNCVATVGACC
ncbi:hypothetical protein KR018_009920 [Drosophila ironensis]|nr:hypothetical protein KR018_009920 [Drosophila ironensis]